MDTPTPIQPALYLIPVPLSTGPHRNTLPGYNNDLLPHIRHYIVENIRSARRFLRQAHPSIDIDSLTFSQLNRHTTPADLHPMLQPLRQGHPVGLISEAGCPAIADPGADIVAIAQQENLPVIPLVGPTSIILSLMASGFNGQTFAFNGYLPIDRTQRAATLRTLQQRIQHEHQTQIFIETPYRNNRLIAELTATLPPHLRLCIASDITGPRQNIQTHTLAHWRRATYDYDKTPTIFLLYK